MNLAHAHHADKATVLNEAFLNAGKQLGMSQKELGEIVGKERTAISKGNLAPASKAGELALLFIRAYRALFVLVGGDAAQMRHWMHTENLHTGGVPAEQVKSVQGLLAVVEYLDAMRGKL
ncbi:MAG TPA: MbcA/ParS/Xre antitoxin family protein [Gammaproteobacteria bacterium]